MSSFMNDFVNGFIVVGLACLSPLILSFALIFGDKAIKNYKKNKRYKIRQNCFWKIELDGDIYCTNYNNLSLQKNVLSVAILINRGVK